MALLWRWVESEYHHRRMGGQDSPHGATPPQSYVCSNSAYAWQFVLLNQPFVAWGRGEFLKWKLGDWLGHMYAANMSTHDNLMCGINSPWPGEVNIWELNDIHFMVRSKMENGNVWFFFCMRFWIENCWNWIRKYNVNTDWIYYVFDWLHVPAANVFVESIPAKWRKGLWKYDGNIA